MVKRYGFGPSPGTSSLYAHPYEEGTVTSGAVGCPERGAGCRPANGISFARPSSWTRWFPNAHNPINDGPLIYLSTDPLLPTCATTPQTTPQATPNPADSRGRACDWPLGELAPNGVLVTWLTTRILVPLPSAGEAVEVNGATGRLQIEKPGSCSAVVADETLDVLVPIGQPKPRPNIAVVACLRGPDLADAEAKVRAMLASAKVSPWEAGGPRAQLED